MACNSPLKINRKGKLITVPCRWCMGCRVQRRLYLSTLTRLEVFEYYKKGRGSSFVTLTFSDDYIGNNSLSVKESQDFIKKFREHLSRNEHFPKKKVDNVFNKIVEVPDFKFISVGEYGSEEQRKHYHMIFLGVPLNVCEPLIHKLWRKGIYEVSSVTNGRIRYILKYLDKQVHGEYSKMLYEDNGLEPPFINMSKGIGYEYINSHLDSIYDNNGISLGGKIFPLNSYLIHKLGLDSSDIVLKHKERFKIDSINRDMSASELELYTRFADEMSKVAKVRLRGSSVSDSHGLQAKREFEYYKQRAESTLSDSIKLASDALAISVKGE